MTLWRRTLCHFSQQARRSPRSCVNEFANRRGKNRSTMLSRFFPGGKIDDILTASTSCSIARELIGKIARARDQLLVFCSFPGEVEPTKNGSERALRPAVIQRKVTNGYRAMGAAEYETAVRSAVDTARLAGAGSFQTIPKPLLDFGNHVLVLMG
jgi:hypothetical protein